jgi:hypothetical protein
VSVNGIEIISLCNGVCTRGSIDLPEKTGISGYVRVDMIHVEQNEYVKGSIP